jgi:hypothetical protein
VDNRRVAIEREGRGKERSGEERKLFHMLITTDRLKGRMEAKLRMHDKNNDIFLQLQPFFLFMGIHSVPCVFEGIN